jgi:hypothetical protein
MVQRRRLKAKKRKHGAEVSEEGIRHDYVDPERPALSRPSDHASSSLNSSKAESSHVAVAARPKLDDAAVSAVSNNLEKRESGSSVYKSLFHSDAASKQSQKDLFINVGSFRYGLS